MSHVWTENKHFKYRRHGDIMALPYEPVRMWYNGKSIPLNYSINIHGAPCANHFSLGPNYPPGYWVDNYNWNHCLEPIAFDWIRSIHSYDFPIIDDYVDFKWGKFKLKNLHYLNKIQGLYHDLGTWVECNTIDCKTIYSFHN